MLSLIVAEIGGLLILLSGFIAGLGSSISGNSI